MTQLDELFESLAELDESLDVLIAEREVTSAHYERVRLILRMFFLSPISMSSVQPILDLAMEMNPDLKETK